ncbi:sugar transferase [Mesorhizobium sp. KR9-304]|uniref:sugar transferase n=1 Tax=Mesorhizobium sp. KR9-304 TaxID=3156614 RepID=UPI0032B58EE7
MKRVLDLALALPLALLAGPVVLAAAAWIRLTSPGPAIFAQERIGKNEARFRCLKLRTMYRGTRSLPTHEIGEHAVTPAGRILRGMKLDELPQLWNVLRGEMSLVGPRPCLPTQKALIERRRDLGVYALKPGMTGLAQVEGIDMSDPEKCAGKDAEYLKNRSLGMDMKILLMTLAGGGLR